MFFQTYHGEIEKQESLAGSSIQESVRQNLSEGVDDEDAIRNLFALSDEAVPSLIKFLSDPDKERRAGAARGLAYIGNQRGMQALRVAVNGEKDNETKSAMSYFLAGGLVEAASKSDLDFLRSSAEKARLANDDKSAFPAVSAALALAMMGRTDSLAILRRVAKADVISSEEIAKAVRWLESKSKALPPSLGPAASDEELIKKVVLQGTFFAEKGQDETTATQLTFNRQRNKVLVSVEVHQSPRSARGYDLVLAKENGVWRVVGIWFAWIT